MLYKDVRWPFHRQFESGTEWEPLLFFSEGLCNSKSFDLMLGFFSSSAIRTLSDGFALFLYNGGKMRLVINNVLSIQDKEAIIAGESSDIKESFDLSDIQSMKAVLSENDKHFFECLAWLISQKRIEIKIVTPKSESGIAHTKTGIFDDGENKVAFNGSCNFTKTALLDNIETIGASCDWDGGVSEYQVKHIQDNFERVFNGESLTVNYVEPQDVVTQISKEFGGKDIEELIEQEKQIYSYYPEHLRPSLRMALDHVSEKVKRTLQEQNSDIVLSPSFPYPQGPRPYQKQAHRNWIANKAKGLFAMATGTGKTITSLNCLLEIYKQLGYYKALILVPTITLVEQWEEECHKFNFKNVVKVSSKSKWKDAISNILLSERLQETTSVSYVVIATYASFVRPAIFAELNSLSSKTLLIADECHNMGSPTMLKLLKEVVFSRRIGLSATPDRQYDQETNSKVFDFFGATDKFTFEYTMEEAIEKGVLCKYYYYPHIVHLDDGEMKEYRHLSDKIARYYNFDTDSFKDNPELTYLLLQRKRIIHKAKAKLPEFSRILQETYNQKRTLKYTLVYVPEGYDPYDYMGKESFDDQLDYSVLEDEDWKLIDYYTDAVRNIDKSITVKKFVSGLGDREDTLSKFANGEIDVLTSMKCLDEGVDVPRAELAIFCASTGNPRQFIQRRGRILRKHKDKQFAYIHDLVVVPMVSYDETIFKMERNLLKKELERVKNFATLSVNCSDSVNALYDIMNYYNLNLYHNE